jgi:ABC-type transport system substrate-binding protein/two-component sensor histidine kinase
MTTKIKVALYSVDPPGLTTFRTFDPESFSVISAINDALIYIDTEGAVQPGLATAWRRVSPLEMEFDLRRGVHFHNGEAFDADSVVATFQAHLLPTPSASAKGILSVVCGVSKVDDFTVRLRTKFPDAMLLRRMFLSSIYPRSVLEQQGREALDEQPIGTGAYRLVSYERGKQLVLVRNREHWAKLAEIECIELPILRQKEWVDRLARGEIDAALGLDSHDRVRASRLAGVSIASRKAAISQWFLLNNRGPLADVRVRKALNHAINRRLLTNVTEHGFGSPARSIATEGQQGYTECAPYRYSPDVARKLLEQAGHGTGFKLSGLVSETSTPLYFMVREFLSRIGVELDAEIVPRAEWIKRIVGGHMSGEPYQGDFAVAMIDNPILHSLFHHFIFLYSHGPFALLHDADYDRVFLDAATSFEDEPAERAQARLEHYARDNAFVLFTVQPDVHAAFRPGLICELPRSGHFQGASLMTLRLHGNIEHARSLPLDKCSNKDDRTLLEGTSHAGAFYLRPGTAFEEPVRERIWQNIQITENRWRLQNEPLLRELVSAAEARANLASVLDSTDRVAIAGYSLEGRQLFVNKGYQALLGAAERSVFEHLGTRWDAIRSQVEQSGSWVGAVHLSYAQHRELYLSVTYARDDEAVHRGYTFVLSDFSGEEERIRHAAIRTILDNVPYGLFMCDEQGRVLPGYSEACTRYFVQPELGIQGRQLTELLAMSERDGDHFQAACVQLFDDFLPPEVSWGNLPERIGVGKRTFALSGSVVRDSDQRVSALLFTLLDITALIEAEAEVESLRGAAHVARYRARFAEFAVGLHQRLQALMSERPLSQAHARLTLHTAKGVFGQFSLRALARQIHAIEDKARIGVEDLRDVDAALQALVERHKPLWNIALKSGDELYTVSAAALRAFEERIAKAGTLQEARAILADGLQSLRRKPVSEWLGPLAEGAQAQARDRDKQVRLELSGGELLWPAELSAVFEVLPHVIRNSIDHGIETRGQRKDKPEVATIQVGFSANDNGMHIQIRDDGRGIAAEQVVRRAVALGLMTAEAAAQLSHAKQLELIFAAGVSTALEVSETSGRGIGMAAVKDTVAALGGSLHVESEPGQGTKLSIDFPRVAS